jgi:catechol 2,3-dioxygenase-like lactoylglutathione lyase family enzyme
MTIETTFKAFRPHISLDVQDLTRSVEFYSALFGIAPAKERPGYAKFSLAEPPLNFSMNERSGAPLSHAAGHLSHLGFEVLSTEEVLAAKARLTAQGIAVREEMETTCCYAKQDKIWTNDPDGNPWEIFVVTEADTERGGSPMCCRDGSCCE